MSKRKKHENKLTQRKLQEIRSTVSGLGHQYILAASCLDQLDLFAELSERKANGEELSYWERQRVDQLDRAGGLTEVERRRPIEIEKARTLKQQLAEAMAPVWAHIAGHPDAQWAKVGEVKPKLFRDELAPVMVRLAEIATKDARVRFAVSYQKLMPAEHKQWLKQGNVAYRYDSYWRNDRVRSLLYALSPKAMTGVVAWEADHPNAIATTMGRVGIHQFMVDMQDYKVTLRCREQLRAAGTIVGHLPDGHELRVMDASSFPALTEYLSCCIAHRTYGHVQRAEDKTNAYVCVYPKGADLPIALFQVIPRGNQLLLGDQQGRKRRELPQEIRSDVVEWVQSDQARAQLVRGLNRIEKAKAVGVNADDPSAWKVTAPDVWNAGTITCDYDIGEAITGIVAGQTRPVQALTNAYRFGGERTYRVFKRQLTRKLRDAEQGDLLSGVQSVCRSLDTLIRTEKRLAEQAALFAA